MIKIPRATLSDGNSIPLLAFGTGTAWFSEDNPNPPYDEELVTFLTAAIRKGFTHIDCAEMYNTEREVGAAIKNSGVPRSQLFVTTKVTDGNSDIGAALDASLNRLRLDYVDLYLVHGPYFAKTNADLQNAWTAMQEQKSLGKTRSIGVSNYLRQHLEATLETAVDKPAVNQLEYHPYLQRANGYIPWMHEQSIQIEAFKSLAPIVWCKGGPLVDHIARIAKAHDVAPDAVLLRWYIQQGVVTITTTKKPERLDQYAQALTMELTDEEMAEIKDIGLTHHCRMWNPGKFEDDDRT